MPVRDSTTFDRSKLQELILFIVEKTPDIGLTKLEKLLYLCDFISAEKTGFPITGETYRHFERGPVPKHIVPILEGMENKELRTEIIPLKNKKGDFKKLTVKRRRNDAKFSPEEKKTILGVIEHFGNFNSEQLVKYVHDDITYKATKKNEDIPYSLAIYRRHQKPDVAEAEELQRDPDYARALQAALR